MRFLIGLSLACLITSCNKNECLYNHSDTIIDFKLEDSNCPDYFPISKNYFGIIGFNKGIMCGKSNRSWLNSFELGKDKCRCFWHTSERTQKDLIEIDIHSNCECWRSCAKGTCFTMSCSSLYKETMSPNGNANKNKNSISI